MFCIWPVVLWLYCCKKWVQAGTQSHWKSLIRAGHNKLALVCVCFVFLLKSHYLLTDITLALVTTVPCARGLIYCVRVYVCELSLMTVCICCQTQCVWKPERAMQWGECRGRPVPIGRALCASCETTSSGVYIATGGMETQEGGLNTHRKTQTHNIVRGELQGELSCALCPGVKVFSHEEGFREDTRMQLFPVWVTVCQKPVTIVFISLKKWKPELLNVTFTSFLWYWAGMAACGCDQLTLQGIKSLIQLSTTCCVLHQRLRPFTYMPTPTPTVHMNASLCWCTTPCS